MSSEQRAITWVVSGQAVEIRHAPDLIRKLMRETVAGEAACGALLGSTSGQVVAIDSHEAQQDESFGGSDQAVGWYWVEGRNGEFPGGGDLRKFRESCRAPELGLILRNPKIDAALGNYFIQDSSGQIRAVSLGEPPAETRIQRSSGSRAFAKAAMAGWGLSAFLLALLMLALYHRAAPPIHVVEAPSHLENAKPAPVKGEATDAHAAEMNPLRAQLDDERSRNRRLQAFVEVLRSQAARSRQTQKVRSR